MTKARAGLTELEGAILGVLRQAAGLTPYAVRRVFLESLSAEWSGSAGAVYPAIKRLASDGLLRPGAGTDKRGKTTYLLTAKGLRAHDAWLCDITRAIGPGMDPFRTRAGLWLELPPATQRTLMQQLLTAIEEQREALKRSFPAQDRGDAIQLELHLLLLESRRNWLTGKLR